MLLPMLLVACGPAPVVGPDDPQACTEIIDPLRDDDRTPYGLRPTQIRAQLGGALQGRTDGGEAVEIVPVWTGGLAVQVWATRDASFAAPDPAPPLWCTDRAEISADLRVQGLELDAFDDGIHGRVAAVGPLDALVWGFVGEVSGTELPDLVPDGQDAASTTVFVWLDVSAGQLDVRAGPDMHASTPILEIGLQP